MTAPPLLPHVRQEVHLHSLTVCGQAVPMHGFCSDELSRVVPTLVDLPKPHEATICWVRMS
jgi:hypothetical protein